MRPASRAVLLTAALVPAATTAWSAQVAPNPPAAPQPAAIAPGAATPAAQPQPPGAVRGLVSASGRREPIGRASVFAYELARLTIQKVTTAPDGAFQFEALPAGVYKLIAFKPGYEPAVLLLSRAAAQALQFVELQLAQEHAARAAAPADFWAVRDQIPPDVLRDLEGLQLAEMAGPVPGTTPAKNLQSFQTSVRASTGVQDNGIGGASQLAGGGIGMEGHIGSMQLGVNGEFWRLDAPTAESAGAAPVGQAANLAVRMAGNGEGQIDVTTVRQSLADRAPLAADNADFERYRVSWSQPMGERSHSHFAAQYTSQSNFLRPSVPVAESTDSRALNLEGSYSVELSDRSTVEGGVRFRELDGGARNIGPIEPDRAVELFGKGNWQLQPSVLVEYGMFSQLRDGSLALAPQGGMVLQLGDHWQAMTTASHRVANGVQRPLDGFTPIRFATMGQDASGLGCNDIEQHCYRMLMARQGDDDADLFAVGLTHRELAETLHLYFDDDFLNQFESLYLVEGDSLPELQMVIERRIAPRVLARFESSYATGGGGILYAMDVPVTKAGYQPPGEHAAYQNHVSYLVTSLDTHFAATSTGVFVAFHHLEQGVEPIGVAGAGAMPPQELERLQLMVSQDLSMLMRLAADWSVHLNFEVSRGSLPFTLRDAPPDELRRRVTGGLSVKF